MRPLTPIATLVLLSGMGAVLSTPPGDAPGYDPDPDTDYVAPDPVVTTIMGVYSTVDLAGVVVVHDAIFLTTLVGPPSGFRPEVSRCVVASVDYLVMAAQERWYLGAPDGYTLHLKL